MTVAQDITTTNPITCQENQSIREAVEIMQNQDTGVVSIINSDNELIGLVTDRDISLQVVLNDLDTKQTSLSNIMQHDLITCTPEEDLEQIMPQKSLLCAKFETDRKQSSWAENQVASLPSGYSSTKQTI